MKLHTYNSKAAFYNHDFRENRLCFFAKEGEPFNVDEEKIALRELVLKSGSPMYVRAMELAEERTNNPAQELYKDLPVEKDWLELFNKEGSFTEAVLTDKINQGGIGIGGIYEEKNNVLQLWERISPEQRKELFLLYIDEHLPTMGKETLKLRDEIAATDTVILEDAAFRMTHIRPLLDARNFQLGNKPVLTEDQRFSAIESLKQKYFINGNLTAFAFTEFNKQADALKSQNVQFNTKQEFLNHAAPSSLTGALEQDVLTSERYNELMKAYIDRSNKRVMTSIEVKQNLAKTEEAIEKATPTTFQRVIDQYNKIENPAVKLAIGAGVLYVLYRTIKSFYNKEAGIMSWLVAGTAGFVAVEHFAKDTLVGDLFSATRKKAGDLIGKTTNYKISNYADRQENLSFTLDTLAGFKEEYGMDIKLEELASSMVMAEVPLKLVAEHTPLPLNPLSGVRLEGKLMDKIKDLAGRPPQNEVILNNIQKSKGSWSHVFTHVFYMMGVRMSRENGYKNMRAHTDIILPRLDQVRNRVGDLTALRDPVARQEYERIVRDGMNVALSSEMTLIDVMEMMNEYDQKEDAESAPAKLIPQGQILNENGKQVLKKEIEFNARSLPPEGVSFSECSLEFTSDRKVVITMGTGLVATTTLDKFGNVTKKELYAALEKWKNAGADANKDPL